MLRILTRTERQEQEFRGIQIGKVEINLYRNNPRESKRKPLELIKYSAKYQVTALTHRN